MSRRTKVVGARAPIMWLLIVIALILVLALAVGGLVIYPHFQEKREAQARLDEAEQHYQAGIAFQNVDDWDKAAQEYEKVIIINANYTDVQTRLAEVKARLAESATTATAAAMAQAEQAQAEAQATAAAAPTATAEALEAHYQKGLGHMNMGRWEQAKAELEQVFEADPNYKEVWVRLTEVEAEIANLTPTPTSIPLATPTPPHTPTPAVVRSSSFDGTNTEGWTLYRGSLTNPGTGGSGGGPNNGCLIVTKDQSDTTGYFVAPSKYHGDWRGYSELRFDLWSSGGRYFTSGYGMYGDIFLLSGYATAQRLLPHRPPDHWETFIVPLRDDGEWTFGGGATSLDDLLVNVTDFQIRAEYGVGEDDCGLDNVELVK